MVDLTGKFYTLDELDEDFIKQRVNIDLYKEYAGRFVKNAYDPNLSDQDESLDVSICMMMKVNNQAFKIEKHVHNYPHLVIGVLHYRFGEQKITVTKNVSSRLKSYIMK